MLEKINKIENQIEDLIMSLQQLVDECKSSLPYTVERDCVDGRIIEDYRLTSESIEIIENLNLENSVIKTSSEKLDFVFEKINNLNFDYES
jgi:hypothetical protein